jgi:hypothetical protein
MLVDLEDTSGHTPLFYALKQTDGKLARYVSCMLIILNVNINLYNYNFLDI